MTKTERMRDVLKRYPDIKWQSHLSQGGAEGIPMPEAPELEARKTEAERARLTVGGWVSKETLSSIDEAMGREDGPGDASLIIRHMIVALERATAGRWIEAQRNVEYAASRLRYALGSPTGLSAEKDDAT